jgi:hypothetical protein
MTAFAACPPPGPPEPGWNVADWLPRDQCACFAIGLFLGLVLALVLRRCGL